jgi:hypothetical protein
LRDPPPLFCGATISCCSHWLSCLLHTTWAATFSNNECEANDVFVEASDDEDDIVSAADILENNELLPLFISSLFLL